MKDFYYILGTNRDCTPAEINEAYRKLAQKLQPAAPGDDHYLDSHFQEITEAYQILSVPDSRRRYDTAYKKNYQRRLYYFKIKHLNIAAALTFIAFTGLFGFYVMNVLNGRKNIKAAVKAQPVAVVWPKSKKHKRKHGIKTTPHAVTKPVTAQQVTTIKSPAIKAVPPMTVPPAIKPDTVKPKWVKTTPALTIQQPVATKPTVIKQPIPAPKTDNTITAYLKANVTGVVSLHELASYSSGVITNIPNRTKVTVLEKGNDFYKIAYNGQTGYVPRWAVAAQ